MPKVSVIIPTYNREKFVARAIQSVLDQTYQDYEIIVIDDGSKDNTKDALKPFDHKIRYFFQENSGISRARNRGIQESVGEYIAFLDSDDRWIPEKLAIQVEILDQNKNVGIVYSKMIILDEQGNPCGFKPEEKTGKNFLELMEIRGDIATSTVITRKECFEKVGKFDLDLPPMEDFDMWLRIAKFYEVYEVEDATFAYYYEHKQQETSNTHKVYGGLVKLEAKILDMSKDAPRRIQNKVKRRLCMHQYTLSRICYKEGKPSESFSHVLKSIARNPLVGLSFCKDNESIPGAMVKFFKPYGFLVVCFLKKTFSQK